MNLTTWHNVDGQRDIMMLEVVLRFITVLIKYNLISDQETSVPLLVGICEVSVLDVEDVVDELEAYQTQNGKGGDSRNGVK